VYDIEFRVVRPDGDVRWVWSRGFPVTNDRGEIYRVAGITEDITERKQVAENRVRLVRGFTHDVKNPLGAADGFLALLEDGIMGELAAKQRDSIARARQSIRRALDLITNVLELARAEAGQIEINKASMSPAEVAADTVDEFRAQAAEKGLALNVDTTSARPSIESDAARVRQIIANLVSNAVKYTPENGHIEVAVRAATNGDAPAAGDWTAIAVSDDGPGIPADKQRTLFTEFTRFDPNAAEGAGIGLAISQRLAVALGGTISVRSEEGVGSTFTLWLPHGGSNEHRPQ
jgi:signal transduction histidine kinase